jgi:CheY-like chemotaxis protein
MAQRLNAEMEIESTLGKGTVIRLSFPISLAAGEESQQYVTAPPLRLRILVVDDDPLIIKSLRDILESEGHSVATAYGGQEGIDTWRKAEERNESFDVVVTDLGMPHVDGRKVATAVKTSRPDTPVVLLTGWGQRMEAEQDVPSHVDCVLNKPPKLHELRTAFSGLVNNPRPAAAARS